MNIEVARNDNFGSKKFRPKSRLNKLSWDWEIGICNTDFIIEFDPENVRISFLAISGYSKLKMFVLIKINQCLSVSKNMLWIIKYWKDYFETSLVYDFKIFCDKKCGKYKIDRPAQAFLWYDNGTFLYFLNSLHIHK